MASYKCISLLIVSWFQLMANSEGLSDLMEVDKKLNGEEALTYHVPVEENFMANDLMAFTVADPKISPAISHSVTRQKRSHSTQKSKPAQKTHAPAVPANKDTKSELNSILSQIQYAHHHKLTRNDIKALAKKAFLLTTKTKNASSPSHSTKTSKSFKKHTVSKKKATNKLGKNEDAVATEKISSTLENLQKQHHSDSNINGTDSSNGRFSSLFSDDTMSNNNNNNHQQQTSNVTHNNHPKTNADKLTVTETQLKEGKHFDNHTTESKTKHSKAKSIVKKSEVPNPSQEDKIASLTSLLEKTDRTKVPHKFLPDFPSGLRMIAWNELLTKKRSELTHLINATDTVNQTSHKTTPKEHVSGKDNKSDVSMTHHVAYLKQHLNSVKSLRQLIGASLNKHCHATGDHIMAAFVAMDKSLARAQAIATMIGKKFHVEGKKIENLVNLKEDEVVETFLHDIFVKFQ